MKIKYEMAKYQCTTPCPFGEMTYPEIQAQVGSLACQECPNYGGDGDDPNTIICNHEEEEKK